MGDGAVVRLVRWFICMCIGKHYKNKSKKQRAREIEEVGLTKDRTEWEEAARSAVSTKV